MNKRRITLFSVPFSLLLLVAMLVALPVGAQATPTPQLTVGNNLGQPYVSIGPSAIAGSNTVTIVVDDAARNTNNGTQQDFDVTVRSTKDNTGITVNLVEDDGQGNTTNTSEFRGTFTVAVNSDDVNDVIGVNDGDTITVSYTKPTINGTQTFQATLVVDNTSPTISSFSPLHNSAFPPTTLQLSVVARDDRSGFIPNNAGTPNTNEALANADFFLNAFVVNQDELITQNAAVDANGVLTASVNVTPANNQNHSWSAIVTDRAGNQVTVDADPNTGGIQNPEFYIDNAPPALLNAETGHSYNTTNDTEVTNRSAIRVSFTEADRLDPTSVEVSDFSVGGLTPQSVIVPTNRNAMPAGQFRVYLVMATELSSDAKPVVQLVGSVRDRAGNQSGIAQVTAADGIAPRLTVTVAGDAPSRPVGKNELVVTVTSDEDLSAPPNIQATRFELTPQGGPITAVDAVNVGGAINGTSVQGVSRTWRATFTRGATLNADGVVGFYVTGNDVGNVQGTAGVAAGAGIDISKAILGEFDTQINGGNNPAFTLNPQTANLHETDALRPFVEINFSSEANEYPFTDNGAPAVTQATIAAQSQGNTSNSAVRADTHNKVDLTVARFGPEGQTGVDVIGQVQRTSDNTFLFLPAEPLVVGQRYTLTVNARDDVGNTYNTNQPYTFSVVAPREYTINIVPGWNLISFPEGPSDAGVNAVFGPNTGIDMILTYDRSAGADVGGPWLVAQRGEDGAFNTNQIVNVDPRKAYWVRTSSFETVRTVIPRRNIGPEGGRLQPPQINVQQGWNLIGVVDAGIQNRGTNIAAQTYLATASWTFAYTFDTATGAWQRVLNEVGANVKVGHGYWLWATSSGIIVP